MGAEVEQASRAAAVHSPWEEDPLGQLLSHADRRGLWYPGRGRDMEGTCEFRPGGCAAGTFPYSGWILRRAVPSLAGPLTVLRLGKLWG